MDDATLPEPPGVLNGLTYEERVDEFIRLLGEGNRVRAAAAAVHINFGVLYRKRREDPAFAKRWEDAQRVPVEKLEAEGLRRAMCGSDKLLMFMLTNLAPEKYKTTRNDLATTGNVSLQVLTGMPNTPVDDLL